MGVNAVTCFMFTVALEGIIGLFDSCIHAGTKYHEGDYILPNDTIIKAESPRECVQCRCRQGLVLCEVKLCPALDCEEPVQNPPLCCFHCPVSARGLEKSSDLVIETGVMSLDRKKSSDCYSNGKRFRNGSNWQPVIGPLGVMACVECRCHEGLIICGRLQCGPLPCFQPRRQLGQCCPVCPPSASLSKRQAFCLPKLEEVFVFRTGNVSKNSDKIEYAFLESRTNMDSIKVHTWNLQPKSPADAFTLSIVPRSEFLERNLHPLGSISKRRLRKYSEREKRLRGNCLVRCFMKVKKLESSFVEYSVSAKSRCGEDEVDVEDLLGGPSTGDSRELQG